LQYQGFGCQYTVNLLDDLDEHPINGRFEKLDLIFSGCTPPSIRKKNAGMPEPDLPERSQDFCLTPPMFHRRCQGSNSLSNRHLDATAWFGQFRFGLSEIVASQRTRAEDGKSMAISSLHPFAHSRGIS
jgi:hypothetical protein